MSSKSKEHLSVTLDPTVIQAIDDQRGLAKRSTFVNNLLLNALEKGKAAK
jgi:hypothetical protein